MSTFEEVEVAFKLRNLCRQFIDYEQITEKTINDQFGMSYANWKFIKQICRTIGYYERN